MMNISDDEMESERPNIDENAILQQKTYEARDRVVNEKQSRQKKKMYNLVMLLQELREGQMRLDERNFARSTDVPKSSNRKYV